MGHPPAPGRPGCRRRPESRSARGRSCSPTTTSGTPTRAGDEPSQTSRSSAPTTAGIGPSWPSTSNGQAAGIDGLIVSWKHEARLDAALRIVVDEATKANLKLIMLYQGLDFDRLPLDDATVASDMQWFLDNYATAPPFHVFGERPVVVWSGTWGYKDGQIRTVRAAIDAPNRALLLGSERSADAYAARASLFDGDAYYWSSPNPLSTPRYEMRLADLAAAVRADGGCGSRRPHRVSTPG